MKQNRLVLMVATLLLFGCGKTEDIPENSLLPNDFIENKEADEEIDYPSNTGLEPQETQSTNPVSAARHYAQELLQKAAQNVPGADTLYQHMNDALKNATIRVARRGKNYKECAQNSSILAFVISNRPKTIHVCPRSVNTNRKSLAQILIHETAHVVGIHDECQATKVEVTAMRDSGKNLAFKNGYMNHCKIR